MRREVAPPINFGQFVVANFNPPILWTRMELTNAILAGEHRRGKRVSLGAIRWDHSDELCVGKPAGIRYRNLRLQRCATGLMSPIAAFEIFAAQDDEGALGPRQMLPDPLSRRD